MMSAWVSRAIAKPSHRVGVRADSKALRGGQL